MRRATVITAAAALLLFGAAVRFSRLRSDSGVDYLPANIHAEWIRADRPFQLKIRAPRDLTTVFGCRFATPRPVPGAQLLVMAFKRFEVILDDRPIDIGPVDAANWKRFHEVKIPPVGPGMHSLLIKVTNHDGRPCLLAFSPQLGIRTGPGWLASTDTGGVRASVLASHVAGPQLADEYPSVGDALANISLPLALVFVVAIAWTAWASRPATSIESAAALRISPRVVRGVLLAAWVVLAANNLWRIPSWVGFDYEGHFEYVRYIAQRRALPLATDGWQTFQSPLFYLLASPLYALLSPYVSDDSLLKALRILPLVCGLLQIEIVYRIARAVFPQNDDLQIVAVLTGGLMPMHIYLSQSIGNEPLAGVLSALTLLLAILLVAEPHRRRSLGYFVVLGSVWGLALLSKVTPVLLAPVMIGAVVMHAVAARSGWLQTGVRLAAVFGACFLISGWYYLRNWFALGVPFAGGWDARSGNVWWQDPSYRNWDQLTSFGLSLEKPIHSGCWSLWDSWHSTMWLDGQTSGSLVGPDQIPWNVSWMVAGAWLGLLPLALILLGCATLWGRSLRSARGPLLIALASVGIYLAAVIDLFVRLPAYCTGKSFYTLGVLPCYALLAAAGAAPLLRVRMLRALLLAGLACWGAAAYVAYFVVR